MRYLLLFLLSVAVAETQAQLPADRWRADIDFLRTTLLAKHPALQNKAVAEPFQSRLDYLSQHLDGHSDLDIALNLQAVLAAMGDAHTRIDLVPLLQKQNPIPLGLGWYDGGVYVSGTTKRFQAILGKKIVRINGMKTEEALAQMQRFVAVENAYSLHKDALQWFRFPAAIRQADVGKSDTLELTYESQPGKLQTLRVYPLSPENKADMQPAQIQPKDPDLRWQPMQYLFYLQYLESDKVLYVQYNRCRSREMSLAAGDSVSAAQLPPFQPFADSVLFLMKKYPDAKLFFDLRFNTGGGASDGVDFARRIGEIPEINKKERLFVAVNLYTFSSAIQVANGFDQFTNATLIGDQPAQATNHFGELSAFVLPNSGLKVVHSTRFMRVAPGDGKTLPLDEVIEPKFEDFRMGKDPVLDYVRKFKPKM